MAADAGGGLSAGGVPPSVARHLAAFGQPSAAAAQRYLDLRLQDGPPDEAAVFDALCRAATVKLNLDALMQLFAWYAHVVPEPGCPAMDAACHALMDNFSLKELIVTLGERGALYFSAGGGRLAVDAVPPAQLVDTQGAGDAFSAVFLLGRALGWPLEQALARASAFAGAVCGIAGAVPDSALYRYYSDIWLCR